MSIKNNMDQINKLVSEITSLTVHNMPVIPCLKVQDLLLQICNLTGRTENIAESLTEVKK